MYNINEPNDVKCFDKTSANSSQKNQNSFSLQIKEKTYAFMVNLQRTNTPLFLKVQNCL